MALIQINLNPSQRELKWFGLLMFAFFVLLGTVMYFGFHFIGGARVCWGVAPVIAAIYYVFPSLRVPLYRGWMYLVWPIGWTISHLILATIYFLLLTPTGWLMRLFGRDVMERRFDPNSDTYWTAHRDAGESSRYFRQF